jgi:hypothetical protein
VKPAPFVYHAPKTLGDALANLAEFGPQDGRVLAGGQSLIPMMAFRMARPAHLIDINTVAGLDRLAVEGDMLSVGACVRHAAFHRPVVEGPTGTLLSRVVRDIAHYPTARYVLRQPGPRRPGLRMVPGRGDTRRRDHRHEPARPPRHGGRRFL